MFDKKRQRQYMEKLNTRGVFYNTTQSAVAQTEVANAVRRHFQDENGKTKKALLLGFDGMRADGVQLLCASTSAAVSGHLFSTAYSAVNALRDAGGLYLSYAGGPADNPQETSTAQGWAAILTGVWGDENGVKLHKPLRRDCATVLRELAEQGRTAAFLAEWPDHFNITYKPEIEIAKEKDLPISFQKCENDCALAKSFAAEIRKGTDCIFGIFEAPDANGHATGFSNENSRYVSCICHLDNVAYKLMEQIKQRPTYPQEDWLILITSDHGGHARGHGTQKAEDRMTFLVTNKALQI